MSKEEKKKLVALLAHNKLLHITCHCAALDVFGRPWPLTP